MANAWESDSDCAGSVARARIHCSNPLWHWQRSFGAFLFWANKYSIAAGSTTRRRRSGCIITTTESIRLSGRVNILGTVGTDGLKEEQEDGGKSNTIPGRQRLSKQALRGRGT